MGARRGDVDTLRALLEEERSIALILDLKEVRWVDEEALKLLAILESNEAKINNSCPRCRDRIQILDSANAG